MKMLRYKPAVPNFGDDLNPVLWPEIVPSLFSGEVEDGDVRAFVGIGTIVGIDPGQHRALHVFSSGAGYTGIERWQDCEVEYHCVRGPITARVLGIDAGCALTDGAILATMIDGFRPPMSGVSRRPVVVPHYETIAFPGWADAVQAAGFDLVDPRGTPENVIRALAGARLVLTESLHGAILADAFGVPWRPFAVSRNFSTAKWADWTASLELTVDVVLVPPPDPIQLFRFGKRAEPFGAMVRLDAEAAFAEFRNRIVSNAQPPFLKAQAKRVLEELPAFRRMLGYNVGRTAQALSDLAKLDPFLSNPGKRESLRDEMLVRLQALARRHGARAMLTT
ncbi:polysaccharide pyruvyl transferase family protein [Novosphingobium kaempferiae]|uniref:polysaccharide pyruvyl transferase family protein n=1 Tax=Novosphingobium kaempferiae TaxID=2896849 RepID=UPI001E41133B|nr:polysaccharide pyruvyl transferase family protein [Novosphingobium kaempferiae]